MPSVLTMLEASRRTNNALLAGIAQSIVTTDQMAARLPFAGLPFDGYSMSYEREGTLPTVHSLPDDGAMQAPSTGTTDIVTVQLRGLGGDIDVVSLADEANRGRSMAAQLEMKCKSIWHTATDRIVNGGSIVGHTLGSAAAPFTAIDAIEYGTGLAETARSGDGEIKYDHATTSWSFRAPGDEQFGDALVAVVDGAYVLRSWNRSKWISVTLDVSDATANGRTHIAFTANNEFDGMNKLCAPSMVIPSVGEDGDVFTFEILDRLLDIEKGRANRAFVMNGKMAIRMLAMQRALGGTKPENLVLPGYTGDTLGYRGVPVLINDNVKSNEAKGDSTTLSSIYLGSFDASVGLFMGVPSFTDQLEVNADPRNQTVMGWRITQLGELEDKAVKRTRVKWYGCLGLRSEKSLARATGIETVSTPST